MVIPAFQLGLGNNILDDIRANFTRQARRERAIITVFGPPVDYRDLCAEKPRPTLYKKCADRFMAEVAKLGARERELRADLAAGRIADDDPRWVNDRPVSKLYAHEAHE
jgi:hypothetical protein